MKGLFDQLLQSMTKRSEQSLAELLPRMIDEKLANPCPTNRSERGANTTRKHPLTRISHHVHSAAGLSGIACAHQKRTRCQRTHHPANRVRYGHSCPSESSVDRLVKEQVESGIQQYLPAVVREQVGTVDQLVRDELQRAVLKQAPLLADDLVRATVGQTIEQAVQRIVPDVAEQHIKAELKRLIETEEASHPSKI